VTFIDAVERTLPAMLARPPPSTQRQTLAAPLVLAGPSISGWRLDVSRELARKEREIVTHRSQYAGLIKG